MLLQHHTTKKSLVFCISTQKKQTNNHQNHPKKVKNYFQVQKFQATFLETFIQIVTSLIQTTFLSIVFVLQPS